MKLACTIMAIAAAVEAVVENKEKVCFWDQNRL